MQKPVGVEACLSALEKRRSWLIDRAGGGYDTREAIALGYATGVLRSARELDLIDRLEQHAIERGRISPSWVRE